MKNLYKKIIILGIVALMFAGISTSPCYVSAAEIIMEIEDVNTPFVRKEVTGYIYRINNGVEQRRLWSYTRGVWIDSDWINV